ncbi:MAG: RNA polymerase sigma factor [Bacilli bacterium]
MNTLIKRAKQGDKDALTELIVLKETEYYRLAYSYMRNSHDSSDCLQEMIVTLYTKIETLRNEEMFYSWSKSILVNICKNQLKKQGREQLTENTAELAGGCTWTGESEVRMQVEQCLDRLSADHQDVVYLRYSSDYKVQQIAETLGIAPGTVKSRLHVALGKLADCLR